MPKNNSVKHSAKISHTNFDELLQKNVKNGVVNYEGFKSDDFKNYLNTLSSAQPLNDNWSRNEKLAFWINAYNAFTIQLILNNYPLKSIRDIEKPWDQQFFKIGGVAYSLNHIEHEILRKMKEPRIHFAIVCASYSCPVLLNKAYEASTLEVQLTNQTKAFLNDKKRNQLSVNNPKISKLFSWFKSDFTAKGSLIDFINTYADTKINANATIEYLDYNWSLNNK